MLETLLRAALRNAGVSAVVSSAGIAAASGEPASSGAQVAMQRRGLELGHHRSRPLSDVDLQTVDQAWCMSARHAAAVRAAGMPAERIQVVAADQGGVPDPFGGDDADYEACAQVLELAARSITADLTT